MYLTTFKQRTIEAFQSENTDKYPNDSEHIGLIAFNTFPIYLAYLLKYLLYFMHHDFRHTNDYSNWTVEITIMHSSVKSHTIVLIYQRIQILSAIDPITYRGSRS